MVKFKILIISLIILTSCNRIHEYNCVCYDNIGTDSVSYETYITKNKKIMAEQYCESLSMPGRPCSVSE